MRVVCLTRAAIKRQVNHTSQSVPLNTQAIRIGRVVPEPRVTPMIPAMHGSTASGNRSFVVQVHQTVVIQSLCAERLSGVRRLG